MENGHQLVSFLRLFGIIPLSDEALICDAFKPKHFKQGEYLFEGDAVCYQLFFVLSGVVRIVTFTERGNDSTYYFMREDQFCTLLKSFNDGVITHEWIQACCTAEVLTITKPQLLTLYNRLPYLEPLFTAAFQHGLLEKIRLKNGYTGIEAAERYQKFLTEQPGIVNRVPLKDVASYLGVTPQSLSRIRRQTA